MYFGVYWNGKSSTKFGKQATHKTKIPTNPKTQKLQVFKMYASSKENKLEYAGKPQR